MSTVLYERSGHVITMTLNRPEAMNAINREMSARLAECWRSFREDAEARVAVITGAGERAFSAGADLKEMAQQGTMVAGGGAAAFLERTEPGSFGIVGLYKPVIAAINGHCLAGALELALACDIRICSENATFGLPEVSRGIMPLAGGTQRLPRLIPFSMAMQMMLSGKPINAADALRIGLVNSVFPLPDLLPTARQLAETIAANAPLAVRATKEAAVRGIDLPLNDGLRIENLLARVIEGTDDAKEGPLAFAERRAPRYQGR
jgi:E-phenylitaconyl-CoA hydratase